MQLTQYRTKYRNKYRTHSVSILAIFDRMSISNEVLTALILTTKDSGTFQYVPYSLMHKYFDAENFCQKYLEKGLKLIKKIKHL